MTLTDDDRALVRAILANMPCLTKIAAETGRNPEAVVAMMAAFVESGQFRLERDEAGQYALVPAFMSPAPARSAWKRRPRVFRR